MNYQNMKVVKLKELARRRRIPYYGRLLKDQLVQALRDVDVQRDIEHQRNVLRQRDINRTRRGIIDEPVPEINAPILEPIRRDIFRQNIMNEPVPEINIPILKPIKPTPKS